MSEYKTLSYQSAAEGNGFVGVLTLNRPQVLNTLNREIIAELGAILDEIKAKAESGALRCLIVTGAGEKSFAAGADIKEMEVLGPEEAATFSASGNAVMEKLENLLLPVIAAINGYALGGGCELALACDFRLASANAQFALPEVGLGVIPGYGGIQRLSRAIGLGRAKDLVFSGRRIKADQALNWGLVNAVYESVPALMAAALEAAAKLPPTRPWPCKKPSAPPTKAPD